MIDFKVTESGWYRTRDGSLAEVVISHGGRVLIVVGYIVGNPDRQSGQINGYFGAAVESPYDLVEYLGKERPAQKKVKKCKAKISLWSCGHITTEGSNILLSHDSFVVETREIQWEVPDNG